MKRWNGWGDESTDYPLPGLAEDYLAKFFNGGKNLPPDAMLEDVIKSVPVSPFKNQESVNVDAEQRLRHACGQSLPDWINMRSGRIPRFPDGVIFANSRKDIQSALEIARTFQSHLIPYGGGTSVVGHINPPEIDKPILTLDLSNLNQLIELDETNLFATF